MEQFAWIFWLIFGVVLVVAEIFTLGFVLLWFGVGSLAAAAASLAGAGLMIQFVIFAVVSIALTAMSRTIFSNYLAHRDEDSIKMGVESLPGQVGTVTLASRGALNEAAVKVYGSTWTAFPADGETLLIEGEKVEVVRVKGSSIIVRKVSDALPEWRGD